MMERELLMELQTAVLAVAGGAVITFAYDLLRIFRRVISHGNIWIGVEDFLFWIGTAFWIFSVFYRLNHGEIRIYTICAMTVGMLVYHKVLSEPFVKISGTLLTAILKVLGLPVKLLKILIRNSENKLKPVNKSSIMDDREDSE